MICENVTPGLRLAPIDRAPSLLLRLARWLCRWRLGKVMMPLRVLYPRVPRLLRAMIGLYRYSESGLSIEPALRHLIELRASQNRQCGFCSDLHHAIALQDGCSEAQLAALDGYPSHPSFDDASRAALRYVDEMHAHGNVSDATFDALRGHFSERQVVEIIWLYAFVTYTNLMAKPLGMSSDGLRELARTKLRRRHGPGPAAQRAD